MRAPVSRSRPLPAGGLAVADGLGVGLFGLAREVAFGLAHGAVGGPDALAILPARRTRGQFQAAQLLRGQRGLAEGVVLAAPEQDPEQAGELAGRGGDRDLVAAAGAEALIEGVQRAGLADGARAGLNQRDAHRGGALLGDVPVAGGRVAGLTDLGVKAEV